MKIRNNDELKLFEETLDRCEASVLVVTAQGEQYDLKDPAQRYIGITAMLQGEGLNEPERIPPSAISASRPCSRAKASTSPSSSPPPTRMR